MKLNNCHSFSRHSRCCYFFVSRTFKNSSIFSPLFLLGVYTHKLCIFYELRPLLSLFFSTIVFDIHTKHRDSWLNFSQLCWVKNRNKKKKIFSLMGKFFESAYATSGLTWWLWWGESRERILIFHLIEYINAIWSKHEKKMWGKWWSRWWKISWIKDNFSLHTLSEHYFFVLTKFIPFPPRHDIKKLSCLSIEISIHKLNFYVDMWAMTTDNISI